MLREFLEDYKGFDFENGEIVLVNQRTGKQRICTYRNGELKTTNPFINFTVELEMSVWNWTHTEKTMLIVI